MTDYPDFQSIVTWHDVPFFAQDSYPLDASNPASGNAAVSNYQGLAVNINAPGAHGAVLALDFYADAAHANPMGSQAWNVPSGVTLQMITPCLGNYLAWSLSSAAPAAENLTVSVAATNTPVFSTRYWGPQNYRRSTGLVVPKAATLTAVLPGIAEGPASLYFNDLGGTGEFSAGIYDLNLDASINNRLAFFPAPTGVVHANLTVPAVGLAFVVINNDAANPHTCDYSLTVDGR